ncbi:MAG: hypothetical protein QOG75_7449 [Mycobacterium sp.]|nr:hypothetical protein [Mycobacterium sp.]
MSQSTPCPATTGRRRRVQDLPGKDRHYAAPRGVVVASRNAFATASGALSGSVISPVNLMTVFITAAASREWWVRLGRSSRATAPH